MTTDFSKKGQKTLRYSVKDTELARVPAPLLPIDTDEYKIRHDDLNSAPRAELYDCLARNWHHPDYRHDYNVHYNEFARLNRRFHDLNYPCPKCSKPSTLEEKQNAATASTFRSASSKSKSRSKSKYMSSYLSQKEQPMKTLKDQILEKAASGEFPEAEKFIAAVMRSLYENGIDPETVQYAFQNVALRFNVNESSSEFEICLYF